MVSDGGHQTHRTPTHMFWVDVAFAYEHDSSKTLSYKKFL
jgi:hypothetical protein